MRFFKHPATVIATVALFVAMGGGAAAYASGLINGSQIKNHSIAAKKLTKKAVKSLHGQRGKTGPAGATGATGAAGAAGATGAPGSALGYAWVSATGVLDAARSKGVNSVTEPVAGFYCFDLSINAKNAIASAQHNSSQFDDVAEAEVAPEVASTVCSAPNQDAAVWLGRGSTNALVQDAFMVVFN